MASTSIAWTNKSWNPIKARTLTPTMLDNGRTIPAGKVGWYCEKVSAGCAHCYAETFNERALPNGGTGMLYIIQNRPRVEIFLDEKVLLEPLEWGKRKPCR